MSYVLWLVNHEVHTGTSDSPFAITSGLGHLPMIIALLRKQAMQEFPPISHTAATNHRDLTIVHKYVLAVY